MTNRSIDVGDSGATSIVGRERYRSYPVYKDSGVKWLGEIPPHWEVKRLKYLASVNDEVLPETTAPGMEIAYVDIGNVDSIRGITAMEELVLEDAPSRARRIVRQGDVIISTVRNLPQSHSPNRGDGFQPYRVHWIRGNSSPTNGGRICCLCCKSSLFR